MKKNLILGLSLSLVLSSGLFGKSYCFVPNPNELIKAQHQDLYGHIDTEGLHALIGAEVSMVIADARTAAYDDGDRIPGAIWLPSNSSIDQIREAIPLKSTLVIVYCTGLKCPASKKLADLLVNLGYTNVIKNPEGIDGWEEAGYQIVHRESI